jgi:chromate transporter
MAPTTGALFRGFLALGLMGFGGVLPLARRMLVEERRWLSGAEFADLLGLCQFLPGGNVINLRSPSACASAARRGRPRRWPACSRRPR